MATIGGFCKWRQKMLNLFYLLLFLSGFVHGGKQRQRFHRTTRGVQSEHYTQTRRMPWWNASENGCDTNRGQGKLLTLKGQDFTREIEDRLANFPNGKYWVGAIAFPQWKWSDGSPLYTYKGYNNLTNVKNYINGYSKITGNSVSKCHSYCKKRSTYTVGLKGRHCFCLANVTNSSDVPGEHESPCPGNPLEKCGGQHGVSVYTADSFLPDPTSAGDCTFLMEDNSWNNFNTLEARTKSCAVSKCAVCYGLVSISDHSSTKKSWDKWNRTCQLYKVTDDRLQQLNSILAYSIYRRECLDGYWVGLRRYTVKKWLSGENVEVPHIRNDHEGTAAAYCLALQIWYGIHTSVWTECSDNLPSLCETVQPTPTISSTFHQMKSTPPRGYSTMTPRTTPRNVSILHPLRSTPRPGNFTITSMTVIEQTAPQSPKKRREDARYEEHSSKTGIYVGTFLGLLALIGLILGLGFSYRRRKFCFKQPKPDDEHVYFDPSHGGMVDSSNHSMSQPTSNPVYCIPVATIKPTYQNPGFRGDDGTDYYNVSPKLKAETLHKHDDKGYGEQENQYEVPTTTNNKQGSNDTSLRGDILYGEMESHYEVPKSGVDSNQEWDDEGWGEDEWDDDTNEEQNIYTLAGKGMEEKRWTEADTLPLNCRSGCHGSHAANDCYNTLGEKTPASASHNVYSHISDVNGTEKGDASYDTTFQRDVRALDDDYCHTEAFKPGEDPKNHGSKTSKPRSNNTGIYENTNTFEGGIYENIDTSGKESSDA